MSIQMHAIYRAGVILPDQPLPLIDGAAIDVIITPSVVPKDPVGAEVSANTTPVAPNISIDEFQSRIERFAVSADSLPIDFSRADIYQDHD
jgi:hypothetical protein